MDLQVVARRLPIGLARAEGPPVTQQLEALLGGSGGLRMSERGSRGPSPFMYACTSYICMCTHTVKERERERAYHVEF